MERNGDNRRTPCLPHDPHLGNGYGTAAFCLMRFCLCKLWLTYNCQYRQKGPHKPEWHTPKNTNILHKSYDSINYLCLELVPKASLDAHTLNANLADLWAGYSKAMEWMDGITDWINQFDRQINSFARHSYQNKFCAFYYTFFIGRTNWCEIRNDLRHWRLIEFFRMPWLSRSSLRLLHQNRSTSGRGNRKFIIMKKIRRSRLTCRVTKYWNTLPVTPAPNHCTISITL